MTDDDNDILGRELAKVGGLLPEAAAKGASLGTRIAAAFLPTETYSEKLALKLAPERALKLGFSVLSKLGKVQRDDGVPPPYPMLKAVIGSGILNMNPAVVYLELLDEDSSGCTVTITAAAKEGLIKQHTASKAVERVVSALKEIEE